MDIETAYDLYNIMVGIRSVEEAIINEYPTQEIRTPVHLCIGQEAIAAGISIHLKDEDYIISNHRSHGHCLAKGMNLEAFFKELYGKQGGVSGGWGGSMHLCDMSKGIVGTSAIVAGGIPIGVGFALKQKIKKNPGVTVIYFGDGSVDEGIFWETLNFAALKKLPVLFVMEDNKYASQTSSEDRHAYSDITSIVSGFGIPAFKVDGNDLIAMSEISNSVLKDIRAGRGPAFLACKTYRWMGHVGPGDDTDTGYRTREEVQYWRSRCPLARMEIYLKEIDPVYAVERIEIIIARWAEEIARFIESAKEAPYAVD